MDGKNNSIGCLGIIIIIVLIYFILKFLGNYGKYEGESAEFWFNAYDVESARYDELKSCIEDNPHDAADQCL